MREGTKRCRQLWSAQDVEFLSSHYPNGRTEDIARQLNRPVHKIYAKAKKLGLAKSQEYLSEYCRLKPGQSPPGSVSARFTKGHTPANKGLRRPGWSKGRMAETQFKSGNISGFAEKNWKPVGTILPDSVGYLRIKVRERIPGAREFGWHSNVWKLYHHSIWEQEHGPIPPKHLLVFKDGNRANCKLENLELISMAENARRNQMWTRYPRELAEAIQLNGQIKRKIRRLTNGKEQK
jgi:hypothetical protein